MPLSTPKTVDLGDGLTLVEPSTQAYRCLSEIIRGTADEKDNVNVSTYKAGIVLLCLHRSGKPYIAEYTGKPDASLSDIFNALIEDGNGVEVLDRFAAEETCSWMDDIYDKVDKNIIPLSKKESLREKIE